MWATNKCNLYTLQLSCNDLLIMWKSWRHLLLMMMSFCKVESSRWSCPKGEKGCGALLHFCKVVSSRWFCPIGCGAPCTPPLRLRDGSSALTQMTSLSPHSNHQLLQPRILPQGKSHDHWPCNVYKQLI